MVKNSAAALSALPLAASLLLAGCGGAPSPDAAASASSTRPPTTTTTGPTPSTTGPTTSPTTSAATVDPDIPAAARAHTPAGAEAFVRYFFGQLNLAWGRPKAGLVASLSAPTCKTCRSLEQTAANSVSDQERVVGDSFLLRTVGTTDATQQGRMTVSAVGYQPATTVVNSSGKVVETIARKDLRSIVTLVRTADGWLVGEIQRLS